MHFDLDTTDYCVSHLSLQKPSFHVSPAEETLESEHPISRSASATSSLDPYYFGVQSPSDSPIPPLPTTPMMISTTPEQRPMSDPVTPGKDPATIDRRGLVGVGELTTPRWTRPDRYQEQESPFPQIDSPDDGFDVVVPGDIENDDSPDSPWTIEAIDGESSGKDEVCNFINNLYYV